MPISRPRRHSSSLPWPILAVAFAAAELKVVQVHFRRETHSFSLSEFPAVIGFFFLSPFDYVVALLVGSTIAFVISGRQRIEKIVFNLTNFALVAVVELAVLYAISDMGGAPHLIDWLAAFAATLAATFVSALTIATVITISGGAPQFEKLPEMIQFGSMVAVANTSLALLAVSVMWIDPVLLWLLVLPLAICLPCVPGVCVRTREARAPRAALPVLADPPAFTRARFDAGRAPRPRARRCSVPSSPR